MRKRMNLNAGPYVKNPEEVEALCKKIEEQLKQKEKELRDRGILIESYEEQINKKRLTRGKIWILKNLYLEIKKKLRK